MLRRYGEGFEASFLDVLLSPTGMWELANLINANGWYSIKSFTPTGAVLWGFWGIEAVIVLVGSALFAMSALGEEVFCERCNAWTSKHPGKVRLAIPEDDSQLQGLAPDNLQPLEALATVTPAENPHLRLDTWECSSCGDHPALQVKVHVVSTDKKGKTEEKTEDVTPIYVLSASAFDRVMQLGKRLVREPGAGRDIEPGGQPSPP